MVTIVDLNEVRYLDTTFLNALTQTYRRLATGHNGSLCVVASAGTIVSRLFAITKIDQRISVFEDIASARRYAKTLPR
ncbi:MAG TPA: STAS domain-containing protein [Candidatus Baltobacteraceae bacterium]